MKIFNQGKYFVDAVYNTLGIELDGVELSNVWSESNVLKIVGARDLPCTILDHVACLFTGHGKFFTVQKLVDYACDPLHMALLRAEAREVLQIRLATYGCLYYAALFQPVNKVRRKKYLKPFYKYQAIQHYLSRDQVMAYRSNHKDI